MPTLKRLLISIHLIIVVPSMCVAQLPNYGWAKDVAGFEASSHGHVAIDNEGAIYWLSTFGGTVDIDPGPGTVYLTSPINWSDHGEAFLAKYSADGDFLWRIFLNTNGTQVRLSGLALDDEQQELAIIGEYWGNLASDPGPAGLGAAPGGRSFLLKYGLAGQYIAHMTFPKDPFQGISLHSVAFAPNGGVYIGGSVYGTMDIDPVGTTNIVGTNWTAFLAKYDYPFDLAWSMVFTGSSSSSVLDIVVTTGGDLLIAGGVRGSSVDFDPGPANTATNAGSTGWGRAFLARYTSTHELLWVNVLGNNGTSASGSILMHDDAGAAYLMGYYSMSNAGYVFDLDPGPGQDAMPNTQGLDYVAKYAADGTYHWGYAFPPNSAGGLKYHSRHPVEQVVLFGETASAPLLHNAQGPVLQQSDCTSKNPFLIGLDTDGSVLWHAMEGTTCAGFHFGEAIAMNAYGRAVVLGNYTLTADASFGTVADHLPDHPGPRPYLMTFAVNDLATATGPLPASTETWSGTITNSRLFDAQGRMIHTFGAAISDQEAQRQLHGLAGTGVYILQGTGAGGQLVQRKITVVN